jgi:tRNA(Ile)-lysidine synthase
LEKVAETVGAPAILLGHTREDQAETVLMRLARGSGARSLAAMAPVSGRWRRPLLALPRAVVRASVADLVAWEDPHNADSAFARVRVRQSALPALIDALGPDVVDGLVRTAHLLRDDADALEALAEEAVNACALDGGGLDVAKVENLPRAIRTRVLRRSAISAGCPGEALTMDHVERLDLLMTRWRGQGAVDLPGGIAGERRYGRLTFFRAPSVAERLRGEGEV